MTTLTTALGLLIGIAALAADGIAALAADGSVPVCKVWRETAESDFLKADHRAGESVADISVFVDGEKKQRFYFSNEANAAPSLLKFKSPADATAAAEKFLRQLQNSGVCHGVFEQSGTAAQIPAIGSQFLGSAPKGESRAFNAFLSHKEPGISQAKNASPEAPNLLQLYSQRNPDFLVGGMSELRPGSGIYLTNRHVLEGLSPEDLARALESQKLSLKGQRCIHFIRRGTGAPGDSAEYRDLDVVLMLPKNSKLLSFEPSDDLAKQLGCSLGNLTQGTRHLPLQMKFLDPGLAASVAKDVELGDSYFIHHLGSVGDDPTKGISSGEVAEQSLGGKFYLPPRVTDDGAAEQNRTAPRSSGSLVYTRAPHSKEWSVGGIVECKVPDVVAGPKDGLLGVNGATRVITFKSLLQSIAIEESCSSPDLYEPRPRPKDCVPIDGRRGGGP